MALEDDLMRLFGSERIQGLIERLNPGDEIPMDVKMLSKQIETAQRRIEARNFEIRKHVLQYDDVMNQQREIIYAQRRAVLMGEDMKANIQEMLSMLIKRAVGVYCQENVQPEEWDPQGLEAYFARLCLPKDVHIFEQGEQPERMTHKQVLERVTDLVTKAYDDREAVITQAGADMREIERIVLLRCVDDHWMDHIDEMDQLRQGIGLRAYGQRDPVVEYKFEGYDMFENMTYSIARRIRCLCCFT